MAVREAGDRRRLAYPVHRLIAVLCLASLATLFLFSYRRSSPHPSLPPPPKRPSLDLSSSSAACNYSDGSWVRIHRPAAPRYDHTCKEIFKGWNCIANGKSNARDIPNWRWQPSRCDLPPLDPARFLTRYRNTSIGFVGDSLNRNMFTSLVCMLRGANSGRVRKWRPAGADRCYTFLDHNLTVAYHRTNLLVHYGRWLASSSGGMLESLGYREGFRVDVDVPDHTWAKAPMLHDILIFNTGHWWGAHSKFDPVKSPMLFFENGTPLSPPLAPERGLDMALKHMVSFVEKMSGRNSVLFFRTQSPRHFEGGDWDQGGSCRHLLPASPETVEGFFSLENNSTNMEARMVNMHLQMALSDSSFRILDVTRMSEFRADAHPSTAGGKKHEDCMHWCLPGLTDTWNDLLAAKLEVL